MDCLPFSQMLSGAVFPYLPLPLIEAAYREAQAGKAAGGGTTGRRPAAALVANTFGLFLDDADALPPLPQLEDVDWPAERVTLQQEVRLPSAVGSRMFLDVLIKTPSHLIGITSAQVDSLRNAAEGCSASSSACAPEVSGRTMGTFEQPSGRLLTDGSPAFFAHLDAGQLLNAASGLRMQAMRQDRGAILFYLYAEPAYSAEGWLIPADCRAAHRAELKRFQDEVTESEVVFRACSYRRLLHRFRNWHVKRVRRHAANLTQTFGG